MATESAVKGPPSNSPGDSYIGSFISLLSKSEIRYEGVLYFLNVHDSTIGLKNVRSYGTEGRRKDGPQIPPSEKVYEYILFRGNDIKNLQIKSPPTSAKSEEQIHNDPAIIQSQLNSTAASFGGRNSTESIQRQDSVDMFSKAIPIGLLSPQSATQLNPSDQSAATQVAGHPSFSTSMYLNGHSGISSNNSNSLLYPALLQSPSMVASPLPYQSWMQTPETEVPNKVGWTPLSDYGLPVSSTNTSLVNQTRSPSPNPLQISDSLDVNSLLPTKAPMPYPTPMTFDGSNIHSFSSPLQEINSIDNQIAEKICPDPRSIYLGHAFHHPSSFVGYSSGPLPIPPSLLTPDQFAHPRENVSPLTQNLTPNQKDMGSLIPTSSNSSVLMPSIVSQAPLLPLPTLVPKPHSIASQFNEEFDFEAMNEKFNKDEVWGSLGKATMNIEGVDDNASSISSGDKDSQGKTPSPKSAYKKDDFFDTISCNSASSGRNGQHRLSERIKLDTETFGNFQHRPNFGYGGGRGMNFRGSNNWGRGYGYGRRGRGPNFHRF
ncbi:protein LSM14 homolog A-like [Arachis ipaensis]|uniref:protein LSM14 homolog A-like n=1 Tax=Arachis ipaensis TaxID=130454 RepID=UPI0007AFB7E8|nr:protein LSM14 homolog A-like [Arachis ipaensis]